MKNPTSHGKALEIFLLSSGQLMEQLASDTGTNRRVKSVGGVSGHNRGAVSCSRHFAAAENQNLQ